MATPGLVARTSISYRQFLSSIVIVKAEAAKHPELKVMIGFVNRFDANWEDAHKGVAAGAIGQPFLVRSHTCDQNDPAGFFVKFAPTLGGIFIDMSLREGLRAWASHYALR